jgi:NAD(P) transhydrogenase subunit alpha
MNFMMHWLFTWQALLASVEAGGGETEFGKFVRLLTVFLLAMWVGNEVITKVPPILHTPLTSGSNAISGITVVGSMVACGAMLSTVSSGLGFLATVFAMINVVGGFLVTHRMLLMFKKK